MSSPTSLKPMGIEVEFPYPNPYPAQRALIANSMAAFVKSENALLESPTGTGKTISLLASSLAYQRHIKEKMQTPEPPTTIDPHPSVISSPIVEPPLMTHVLDPSLRKDTLKVFYTSRTHPQLSQVIDEFKRKLPNYRPKMVVLASREKLCINDEKKHLPDLDRQCRNNLNNQLFCPYVKNTRTPPFDFLPGGEYDKYDIEDIKDYCREKKLCPYSVTRALLRQAEYIFCPYNYILDETIRAQMKLDLNNSIVLIDEGHNIEGTCRDSASLELKIDDIEYLSTEMHHLVDDESKVLEIGNLSITIKNSLTFIDKIHDWMQRNQRERPWSKRFKSDSQDQFYEYPDVSLVLSGWTLTSKQWQIYAQDIARIIDANEKAHSQNDDFLYIPDKMAVLLNQFFIIFKGIFEQNCIDDYSLIVTNFEENLTLKLLCMSPAVAFKTLTNQTHSIILTSGTLSPLDQYESELRVRFPHKVSAKHVIDSEQVNAMIVTGLDGVVMTSANKVLTSPEGKKIYSKLGEMMLNVVQNVPDGVLLFFPSSKIMRDCLYQWGDELKQRIKKSKPLFIDYGASGSPRRQPQTDVFKDYKSSVNQGNGGLLIGVMRGKLSEGIDFIDKQARAVVVFGIPYPSYFSPEVMLKRKYNDAHMLKDGMEKNPLIFYTSSGMDWYSAQAYRALAQAVGRCIRHQDDYGSIILVDQRYPQDKKKFPQWMQMSLKDRDITSIQAIENRLKIFYDKMLQKFPNSRSNQTEINENDPVIITHSDCLNKLVRVVKLEKSATFNSGSRTLMEIFNHNQSTNGPLVLEKVRPGDCIKMEAVYKENVWSEQDGLGYQPICCPCGEVVGVHVHAAAEDPEKIQNLSSDYFFVDRCFVTQRRLSDSMSTYVIRPKDIKMLSAEKGQMKLAFG